MEKLEVFGANVLKGQVRISGSKNASLPILAATLLSDKKVHLSNLPKVKDIETMLSLLKSLDSKIEHIKGKKLVSIKNNKKNKTFVSYSLVKTMRAGILVLGSLLARYSKAKVSLPGGCAIGTRPIDIHLKALSKLGVRYKIVQGYVTLEFSNTTPLPAKIYANEGVAQFIFLKGNESPEVSYSDRKGKYMKQGPEATLPKL